MTMVPLTVVALSTSSSASRYTVPTMPRTMMEQRPMRMWVGVTVSSLADIGPSFLRVSPDSLAQPRSSRETSLEHEV